jgi:non-heme chloroperoxidase
MKTIGLILACTLLVLACALGLAIALGSPAQPMPLRSINDPFKTVDFSGMPPVQRFAARDGTQLGFRQYRPATAGGKGSVVLIHGSSASSNSMHPIAKGFAQAGYTAYALDMRGHGVSGQKGQIAYIGQLEDDLADFMQSVHPDAPVTLTGFSSGGGFALRFAGGSRQKLFSNYLLLAPYLHYAAPTIRPDTGGWVKIGMPRMIALTILNRVGITAWNDLPVLNMALDEKARNFLTPSYSFALTQNFRPQSDYQANLRAAQQPMEVLVGEQDELFYAKRFSETFRAAGRPLPVTLVPAVSHITLTLEPAAIQAAVSAVNRLDRKTNP